MDDSSEVLTRLRARLRGLATSAQDTNAALEVAQFLGAINWHNNDGHMSEHEFELDLYTAHAPVLDRAVALTDERSPRVDWLHVISSASDSGGHTRLLENLVKQLAREGFRQSVVITRTATSRFAEALKAVGVRVVRLEGSPTTVAASLAALGRAAECVLLHIHPDDASAALAARALRDDGHTVLFVNHADHVFSFATSAANSILEVSGFGWRQTVSGRAYHQQSFLGIPIELEATHDLSVASRPNGSILSIGSAHKYTPVTRPAFLDLLEPILDSISCTVDIVGVPPNARWARSINRRYPGRLRLLGRLPYADTFERLKACRLYVDSMPVTGGTALAQALAFGCQIYGLWQYGGGYGVVDTLRSQTLDDLVNDIRNGYESRIEPPQFAEVRDRIARLESSEAVAHRLKRAAVNNLVALPAHLTTFGKAADYDTLAWRARKRVIMPLHRLSSVDAPTRLSILRAIAFHGGLLRAARTPMGHTRWLLTGRFP